MPERAPPDEDVKPVRGSGRVQRKHYQLQRTPQDQDKFVLRLPDGLRDRIKAAAEANNRSMNAEIVGVLEEKFPAPRKVTAESLKAIIRMLKRMRLDAGTDAEGLAALDRVEADIARLEPYLESVADVALNTTEVGGTISVSIKARPPG